MTDRLPALRRDLDMMPSPVPEQPGLLIRDGHGYSEAVLVIPPPLVRCLACFDGDQTEGDLRLLLVRMTGELDVAPLVRHLVDTLRQAGFLEDDEYERRKQERHAAFSASPIRYAAHAGAAYPGDASALRAELSAEVPIVGGEGKSLRAIAAPHVSPFGGWSCYRAAYQAAWQGVTDPEDKTFIVLGTSHHGQPDRFGLTRKPFQTPFGTTRVGLGIVDELERRAPGSVLMEDYCHATEHSIEFQIVFLQYLFGPEINIVPVLCGGFWDGMMTDTLPERNEAVRAFLDVLGDIGEREADRLVWVLGVDMAHIGERYGDQMDVQRFAGPMQAVEQHDRDRITRINTGDAEGYWRLVQEGGRDDLKWCGSAPFYTFLRAQPQARGELLQYDQWNIDEASVVSFAGMRFTA